MEVTYEIQDHLRHVLSLGWNVPQDACVRGLVPNLVLLGGGGTFKMRGP
jgi:hypothetical protein